MADNPSYDFASRDYTTIRRDLIDRASRSIPDWTDRDPSDFATMLIELWAYSGDILHYYIDRAAGEAYLSTATQRESVVGLANLYDYTPRYRSPATGTVYIANTSSASVTIPAYTAFSGTHADTLYNFYSTFDVSVLSNTTSAVTINEGSVISGEVLTTSSNGAIGQRYTLLDSTVVPSSVQVFVYEDGVTPTEYFQVAHVNTTAINVAGFSVYPSTAGGIEVVFGNRLGGRIPPVGSKITATYTTCSGASGNVPANKVTSFKSTPPTGLTIGGSTSTSFGADSESVDSIKRSLKAVARTQERAVTLNDYADFANLVTGVYKSVIAYNASTATASAYVMPYIDSYTSYTGFSASVPTNVQTEVVSTLQAVSTLGVAVVAAPTITIHRFNITAGTVFINSKYVANSVISDITNALNGLFELNNLDFGKEIRIADVYKTIMNVDGVDYVKDVGVDIRDSTNTVVNPPLSNLVFLRKGTFTLTYSGGVTTI